MLEKIVWWIEATWGRYKLYRKLICNDFCQEVNLKNHHKFIEF